MTIQTILYCSGQSIGSLSLSCLASAVLKGLLVLSLMSTVRARRVAVNYRAARPGQLRPLAMSTLMARRRMPVGSVSV